MGTERGRETPRQSWLRRLWPFPVIGVAGTENPRVGGSTPSQATTPQQLSATALRRLVLHFEHAAGGLFILAPFFAAPGALAQDAPADPGKPSPAFPSRLREGAIDAAWIGGANVRARGGTPAVARYAAIVPEATMRLLGDDACFGILAQYGVTTTRDEARDRLSVVVVLEALPSACTGDVHARTIVGVAQTYVCPGFAELRGRDAMATVEHELLHSLGLGEAPSCATCPTAAEIQRATEKSCRPLIRKTVGSSIGGADP